MHTLCVVENGALRPSLQKDTNSIFIIVLSPGISSQQVFRIRFLQGKELRLLLQDGGSLLELHGLLEFLIVGSLVIYEVLLINCEESLIGGWQAASFELVHGASFG